MILIDYIFLISIKVYKSSCTCTDIYFSQSVGISINPIVMDFKDKVVLITGASSGIGAATAIYLAILGASLSLTGRNTENLKSVAKKCKGCP